MTEPTYEILRLASDLVAQYGDWFVFLAVFLSGETAILISFLLTEQGVLIFQKVLILSVLATLAADMFWFLLGRYFPERFIPKVFKSEKAKELNNFFERTLGGRVFLSILLLKFFIGTRLLIILYFSRHQISTVRFVIYNIISIICFVAVLSVVGITVGKVALALLPAYKAGSYLIVGVLLVLLLLFVLKRTLPAFIMRQSSEKSDTRA